MATASPFRVRAIVVKRGDAIDQIKFDYDDDTSWSVGHDGGKTDARTVTLTQGEYIVKVVHEIFRNLKCAGAAVEFATNKGRVFGYHPAALSTKKASEQTTMAAGPGQEIISLVIEKGELVGIVQQAVPTAEWQNIVQPDAWFTIAVLLEREDGVAFQHFHRRAEAQTAWRAVAARVGAKKKSRGAVLLDTMRLQPLSRAGGEEARAACTAAATAAGFAAPKKEEEVSVVDTVLMLVRLLSNRRDAYVFCAVLLLLLGASYFDLYASVMTGQVLSMFGDAGTQSLLRENWAVGRTCASLGMDCAGDATELRSAMLLAFTLVKMLQNALYVANVYIHHNACDSKNHQLRTDAFRRVLSLDQAFFDTHSLSEIRSSMKVHSLNNMISWNIPYLISRTLKLAMLVRFMARIDVRMTALSCGSMLVIKFGLLDTLARREKVVHKVQRKLDTMNEQIVDEAFDMVTSIKLFGKEQRHIDEHVDAQLRYMRNINAVVVLRCVREFGYGVLKVGTFCGVLFLGLRSAASTDSTMGTAELTAFFLLFQQFQDVFSSIKWHYDLLVREFPDIDRFLTLMREEPTITSGGDGTTATDTTATTASESTSALAEPAGVIAFDDVHFAYPSRPGEETLKGLTLTVEPGKMTAIVGSSGAGKSTVTKLLLRLYDPASGSISIDGVDLRALPLGALHARVAIVPQNPELFSCSLAENIAYGAGRDVTQVEIVAAAKLANCHEFIERFRSGYDTYAGARGAQLSAGQKQRIAIARAAILRPRVLVLDEATSSLDVENERLVQEALERVMAGRTTIVIAHRLCTIKNADRIVCMQEGRLLESGTHCELMAAGGAYCKLVSKQLVEAPVGADGGKADAGMPAEQPAAEQTPAPESAVATENLRLKLQVADQKQQLLELEARLCSSASVTLAAVRAPPPPLLHRQRSR
jgi:ABC-type multidrug transport system fused ATPase/permease subunit